MKDKDEKKVTNEKPVSLFGPDFKDLLKAFLKVKPEEMSDAPKKPVKKKTGK